MTVSSFPFQLLMDLERQLEDHQVRRDQSLTVGEC